MLLINSWFTLGGQNERLSCNVWYLIKDWNVVRIYQLNTNIQIDNYIREDTWRKFPCRVQISFFVCVNLQLINWHMWIIQMATWHKYMKLIFIVGIFCHGTLYINKVQKSKNLIFLKYVTNNHLHGVIYFEYIF